MIKKEKNYQKYFNNINYILSKIDHRKLLKIQKKIYSTILKKKTIYIFGNGGSAAIANHYTCDYLGISKKKKIKPKIISLSNNVETITAIANDISFDEIFRYQANNYIVKGDLIIALSVSGNSKNIKNLLKFSSKKDFFSIGFCGVKHSFLSKNANLALVLNEKKFGIAEDVFQILMHSILENIINTSK